MIAMMFRGLGPRPYSWDLSESLERFATSEVFALKTQILQHGGMTNCILSGSFKCFLFSPLYIWKGLPKDDEYFSNGLETIPSTGLVVSDALRTEMEPTSSFSLWGYQKWMVSAVNCSLYQYKGTFPCVCRYLQRFGNRNWELLFRRVGFGSLGIEWCKVSNYQFVSRCLKSIWVIWCFVACNL